MRSSWATLQMARYCPLQHLFHIDIYILCEDHYNPLIELLDYISYKKIKDSAKLHK